MQINTEILVQLSVAYAVGLYIVAFSIGILNANLDIRFDFDELLACICWPIFIPAIIVVLLVAGLLVLCSWVLSKMRSKFPAIVKFIQTMIFTVSLIFRPIKLGEIISKRIWK